MEKTPEQLLNEQIATCLAAMQDCLVHSRAEKADDTYGHQRHNELTYVAKLMKASARLTESLERLKGETSHNIRVHRDADKGQG